MPKKCNSYFKNKGLDTSRKLQAHTGENILKNQILYCSIKINPTPEIPRSPRKNYMGVGGILTASKEKSEISPNPMRIIHSSWYTMVSGELAEIMAHDDDSTVPHPLREASRMPPKRRKPAQWKHQVKEGAKWQRKCCTLNGGPGVWAGTRGVELARRGFQFLL